MHSSGIGPVAFFWGTIFAWGKHSCLGAQKPLLVQILPSYLGVKTKNKTKRSLSQMHPDGVGHVAFLWGTHSRVRAKSVPKPPLAFIAYAPNSVGSVAFLWGTILPRLGGSHFLLGGHRREMTPKEPSLHGCFYRKFTALVL